MKQFVSYSLKQRDSKSRNGQYSYLFRVFLGRDENGKQRRFTRTIRAKNKTEARLQANELMEQLNKGKIPYRKTLKLDTFKDWADFWLEEIKTDSVSERTAKTYASNLERYIFPHIGSTPLIQLGAPQLQAMYNVLHREQGLKLSSLRLIHAPVNSCLKKAVEWGKIGSNPAAGVSLPKGAKAGRRRVKTFDPKQANRFLDAAHQTPWGSMFETALASGMRPGEYQGLLWESVLWEESAVRVERAVKRPPGRSPKLGPPKTKAGYRTIPLPLPVMEGLKLHRKRQMAEIEKQGEQWSGEFNLVFPDSRGGIWSETQFRNTFLQVLEIAGLQELEISPYGLRHTCATLLLLKNVHVKIVSERLGHSKISETLDTYSHVLPTMQKQASDELSKLLFKVAN